MENQYIVELRGNHPFPDDVAVAPAPEPVPSIEKRSLISTLSAHEFSNYTGEYGFGISRPLVVQKLREIADVFENGGGTIHRVQIVSEGRSADYTRSALILEFTAKDKIKPDGTLTFGS